MHIVLLQGPASNFFAQLARGLAARGHRVTKVNFSGGCDAMWRGARPIRYRGSADQLPQFYADLFAAERVDAVILFEAFRSVHVPAIEAAKQRGIAVWVFDEGYFQPHWITMDLFGAGPESALPRTPARLRVLARRLQSPAAAIPVERGSFERAFKATRHCVGDVLGAWRYPHKHRRNPIAAAQECLSLMRRFAKDRLRQPYYRAALTDAQQAAARGAKVFLVPLQLDRDDALRRHSAVSDMATALDQIMGSFARHAPGDAILLILRHPRDAESHDRLRWIRRAAARHGIARRVRYFAGDELNAVPAFISGVVTVDSAIGIRALELGKPVKLLGRACYAVPGLVSAQSLEHFWREPQAPDASLYEAFRKAAIVLTQINGGFYSRGGRWRAVQQALDRIEAQGAYISLLTEASPAVQLAHTNAAAPRAVSARSAAAPAEPDTQAAL